MSIKLFGLVALLLVASQLILITTLMADGKKADGGDKGTARKQSTTTCMAANTSVILVIGDPELYGTKKPTTWRLIDGRQLYGPRTIATGKLRESEDGVLSGKGTIITCTN